jgi:adenosylcobinamide-phosphate synthase
VSFTAAALALLVERFTGYPDWAYRRAGHPVEWLGWLIAWLDSTLNRPQSSPLRSRLSGVAALMILLVVAGAASLAVTLLARLLPLGWVVEALCAVPLLAQKSLRDHVAAVAEALERSLPEARTAVAMIVGRDPASLDESGVSRAALESLAENASDGVVAPVLWFAIAGLPGIVLYKAINTADSMIGHRSRRYLHFGWATARLDDLANLPASRLTGLLFAGAAWFADQQSARRALTAMWRDAGRHVSPNAGWPEAALAGALGISLGGPRSYDGRQVDLATMGQGRGDLSRADIRAGLGLYGRMLWLLLAALFALAVIF